MHSKDALTRYRAASALHPVIIESPKRVQKPLCQVIQKENEGYVINHLLWVSYKLGEIAPNDLLDAIEVNKALDWYRSDITAGMTLALLGDIAGEYSSRVLHLLPHSLEFYSGWACAFLSEMLVYAWWRCAEHISDAYSHLISLSNPNLKMYQMISVFSHARAAMAQLSTICLQLNIQTNELSGKQTPYPEAWLTFLLFKYGRLH